MNIGFIPESLGGTEFYTYNLAQELHKQGKKVTVLAAVDDLSLKRYSLSTSTINGIHIYKIANSHLYARTFKDFFINEKIDQIFKELVAQTQPDLIHFQHLALLSGNLPKVAHELHIPSVFTLHDYWMICHRSRLLRPGCGICSGPSGGANCATCDDGVTPNPIAVPKFPNAVQFLNKPSIKKTVTRALEIVPQKQIVHVRSKLFGTNPITIEPDAQTKDNSQFRHDFLKRQLTYPQVIISPSHHLKGRFEDEGLENIQVVPLGFRPITPLKPLPFKNKLKITFLGSLERHKGITHVLNELLEFEHPSHKLEINIYGYAKDPIYTAEAKKLAQQFSAGNVCIHGSYRSDRDLEQIFANSHLVIFPSIWEENHPLVLREAILYGRPVIASNLGGVSEIIKHRKNGLLFNPHTHGDFVNQLTQVLDQPELLNTITTGAVNTPVETLVQHAVSLSAIYEQAAASL